MAIDIVPFAEEHLDPAAELLAARHRAQRVHEPVLSDRYANPFDARIELAALWQSEEVEGVAAIRDGRMVGYLLGIPDEAPPTSAFSIFDPPGRMTVRDLGHAVEPDDAAVYHRLYEVLGARWVDAGKLAHGIDLPAHDRTALETWFALGFGQMIVKAVRPMNSVTVPLSAHDVMVRQATMADEEAVQQLAAELFRSFADPPIFLPSLPEAMPDLRQRVHKLLGDPSSPVWIAIRNDRVEAMQLFITPDSPSWHFSSLSTPERSLYLMLACTDANARSSGINTALLARTMEWAAGAGYAYCILHYLTASRAARYWTSQGFRQLTVSLHRHLDPRLAVARPTDPSDISVERTSELG